MSLSSPERFWRRLQEICNSLVRQPVLWNQADSVVIVSGKQDSSAAYSKTTTIQEWLLGVEVFSSCLVIHEAGLRVITGKNGCAVLKTLQNEEGGGNLKLELIEKNKADQNEENWANLVTLMAGSGKGKNVGWLCENETGSFATKFCGKIKESELTSVDISRSLSNLVAVKQKEEIACLEKSSHFSSECMKWFKKKLETIVENDDQIKHVALSDELGNLADKPRTIGVKFKSELLEPCYDPLIQSGGVYSLKPSAQIQDSNLHYDSGTIVVSLGYRFRNYCSNIVRTFFFNASKDQRRNYKILTHVYTQIMSSLKHGVRLSDVWNIAIECIRKTKPELEQHFTKNVGWATGIEFKDKFLVVNKKNHSIAKLGMVFCIHIGFKDLVDEEKKNKGLQKASVYSLAIADTVQVQEGEPEYLTHFHRKILNYEIAESEDEEEEEQIQTNDLSLIPTTEGRATRSRNKKRQIELGQERQRRMEREKKQRKLDNRLKTDLQKLFTRTGNTIPELDEEKVWVDPESYRHSRNLQFRHGWLSCDMHRETLLCPVFNQPMVFHISTIKNVKQTQIGDRYCFRVSFHAPLGGSSKSKTQPQVYYAHPNAHFVKELTYYSQNPQYFTQVNNQLKELQKQLRIKVKQGKQRPLVKQPNLIRQTGAGVIRLSDLHLKPAFGRSKGSGYLEAHKNGLIFIKNSRSRGPEKLYIIYDNIAYAFYQPARGTPAVILHFHLKNEVMVGKKRTKDVQVFHDVIDRFDETSRHNRFDGAREEEQERKRRSQWNRAFKAFVQRVERLEAFPIHFDIPEMDLSFQGVPDKTTVTIYPTKNCLIALDDAPTPFVLALTDVQLCHFERVSFALRNFDMTFVFKDLRKDPVRISTIPREYIDTIQDFLNLQDILYTQGTHNLDWKRVMERIRSDLGGFIKSGGWDFLREQPPVESDNEDGDAAGDDYAPEEDAWQEDEASDDYDEDDQDDYADEEEKENSEFEDEDEEEEEEILDWDELEKRAAASDRKKDRKRTFTSEYRVGPRKRQRRW